MLDVVSVILSSKSYRDESRHGLLIGGGLFLGRVRCPNAVYHMTWFLFQPVRSTAVETEGACWMLNLWSHLQTELGELVTLEDCESRVRPTRVSADSGP